WNKALGDGWRWLQCRVHRRWSCFGTSPPLVEEKVVSIAMGGEMTHTSPMSTVDQGFGRWLALPQGGLRHQWIRVGASSPPVAAGDVLAAIGGDSKPAVRTIGGRSDHRRRMWPAASRDNVRRGGL